MSEALGGTPTFDLTGRTVLITGAAQGIGLSLSHSLAAAGANLVLVDVAQELLEVLEQALRSSGANVFARKVDVSDADGVTELRNELQRDFAPVDVLVNNAAIGPERNSATYLTDRPKFWLTEDPVWLQTLKVNVFGVQLMSRIFVGDMVERGWGRIVNIGTSLDTMYRPGIGAYGPAKAAVEAASRIMSHDVDGTGVTVNVLLPGGPVNTRMVPAECGFDASELIQPEQMVAPLLWLCSQEADHTNGYRIVARDWSNTLPIPERLHLCSAPIAWPQLGSQSRIPK